MNTPNTETVPDHVVHDFLAWLWYMAETRGTAPISDDENVTLWVDTRMAFRSVGDLKPSAVLTGESPSASPEARAALRGGKVIDELRVSLRRQDREYLVTLRGGLQFHQAKLPAAVRGGDFAEMLYERMFLYEELQFIVAHLFQRFAQARVSTAWGEHIAPDMRRVFASATDADPSPADA